MVFGMITQSHQKICIVQLLSSTEVRVLLVIEAHAGNRAPIRYSEDVPGRSKYDRQVRSRCNIESV